MNEKSKHTFLTESNNYLFSLLHDIKTPLSGILGLARSLYDNELDGKKKEKLFHITQSVEILSRFLGDLFESIPIALEDANSIFKCDKSELGVPGGERHLPRVASADLLRAPPSNPEYRSLKSRILNGEWYIDSADKEKSLINLEMLLFNCVNLFRPGAEIKNLTLSCGYKGAKYVSSNTIYLQKIIINLLENAIKFTDFGGISVSCEVTENIELKVVDTGVGIAQAYHEKIYDKFFSIKNIENHHADDRQSGFGLYAVRQMLYDLNGSICVDSQPGLGTTFCVSIPIANFDKEHQSTDANSLNDSNMHTHQVNNKSILLVEDSAVSQLVQAELLAEAGFTVDVADNGLDAVKKFLNANYDAVLLDIQLPDKDAYHIAKEMRLIEEAKRKKKAVIVLITAYLPKSSYAKQTEHVELILEKPITPVHINLIKKALVANQLTV